MSGDITSKQPKPKGTTREDRLKQALKANLARRKAQARVRGAGKAGRGGPEKGGEQEG